MTRLGQVGAELWQGLCAIRRAGIPVRAGLGGLPAVLRVARGCEAPLGAPLRLWARGCPDRRALVGPDRTWSYADADREVDDLARGLAARGVGGAMGGLVALRNRPETVLAFMALARAGATPVLLSWQATAKELQEAIIANGARVVFCEPDAELRAVEVRAALLAERTPCPEFVAGVADARTSFTPWAAVRRRAGALPPVGDTGVVMYTSGTTGRGKRALRRFPARAVMAALRFVGEAGLRHEDVHLTVCPLHHATAFGFAAITLALGGTVVVQVQFEAEAALDAIERHGVTHTAIVPTMLRRFAALGANAVRRRHLGSLRAIFCGGAPLSGRLATEAMAVFGPVLFNFYGATETGLVTLATPADLRAAPDTIGRPLPGVEVRLLDPSGHDARPGEVGELYARSGLLFDGYVSDGPAARAFNRDGFVTAGDLARHDTRGLYFLVGRTKDVINTGGEKVYPHDVERVLEDFKGVTAAAVVGVPDPEWGERVEAFVVGVPGATIDPDGARRHCSERLPAAGVPKHVTVVDDLPRTATGKVVKRALLDLAKPGVVPEQRAP